MTIVIFILILALLVLVHEFGHFITARKSGMRVYEFGFGFPPRAFGVYRDPVTKKFVWIWGKGIKNKEKGVSGELNSVVGGGKREEEFPATVYSLNWLPLGGFCKIKGEEGENAKDSDSFGFQKAWKKVIVLVAGVTMNIILAGVLLSIGFMVGLPADLSQGVDERTIVVQPASITVQQIEKDSPAEKGGVLFGDKVKMINGVVMSDSAQMVAYVREHTSEELKLSLERQGEIVELTLKPELVKEGEETPRLGVTLVDAGIVRYPWYLAIYKGLVAAGVGLATIFISLYYLLKNLILGQGLIFDVAGPVGIATIVGDSVRLGFNYLINLTAMLSLTLAAINILPIPALDGGRIVFILIEKIFRRPVPLKYEQLAHTIGFVLLMALIVVVTFRDVKNLF